MNIKIQAMPKQRKRSKTIHQDILDQEIKNQYDRPSNDHPISLPKIEEKDLDIQFLNQIYFKKQSQFLTQINEQSYENMIFEQLDTILVVATFSNDTKLLTGDTNAKIHLMDLRNGDILQEFIGHQNRVHCLEVLSDEFQFLSGSEDMTIRQWFTESGSCLRIFDENRDSIYCIKLINNDKQFLSGSEDNSIRLQDIHENNVKTLIGHKGAVFVVEFDERQNSFLSGSYDESIRLWDVKSGKCIKTQMGHQGSINCLKLLKNTLQFISGSSDRYVKLWDLKTTRCIKSIKIGKELLRISPTNFDTQFYFTQANGTILNQDIEFDQTLKIQKIADKISSVQVTKNFNSIVQSTNRHVTLMNLMK